MTKKQKREANLRVLAKARAKLARMRKAANGKRSTDIPIEAVPDMRPKIALDPARMLVQAQVLNVKLERARKERELLAGLLLFYLKGE